MNRKNLAIGAAILAAISVFLPWVEGSSSVSGMGQSFSYSSGGISVTSFNGGILGLLIAIGGAVMVYKEIKMAFIAGIINLLTGMGYLLG